MNRFGAAMVMASLLGFSPAARAQTAAQSNTQANVQGSADAGNKGTQASASGAAASSTAAQTNAGSASLAGGTTFNVALSAPVDSKKAKPGDPVKARTTEPCKSNGKTVLQKGTQLIGHVTQASARANGQAESSLGIIFDQAVLKNGEKIPLSVGIEAVASAESSAAAAVPDIEPVGNTGGSAGASGMGAGRGALGGVTNTVANTANAAGNTVNAATRTTTNVAGSAGAGVNGAVGGLNSAGNLTSDSRGVFGLNGMSLSSAATSTQGSVITTTGKNVHLDSGTRLLLVAQSTASAGNPTEPKEQPRTEPQRPNKK